MRMFPVVVKYNGIESKSITDCLSLLDTVNIYCLNTSCKTGCIGESLIFSTDGQDTNFSWSLMDISLVTLCLSKKLANILGSSMCWIEKRESLELSLSSFSMSASNLRYMAKREDPLGNIEWYLTHCSSVGQITAWSRELKGAFITVSTLRRSAPDMAVMCPIPSPTPNLPALPPICLTLESDSDVIRRPSYFSRVVKTTLLIFKFNPIPIASDATTTSYFPSLNNRASSERVSGGRAP
ncbi:hypothetical protein OGAPHI_006740 [Ogataea philodendri]|uniref:Uncharacterized protein n=1 Tax=Ogataea philodendri TaxID=1378263 RepID=A0A9P8NWU1_9ASCO|nr:uncharacterized protein OGAPHI_006740 [Ogataea philodendri]KAH3661333.1 hypothetical protein OGAPHI_006740 [Ogataea philodendri]